MTEESRQGAHGDAVEARLYPGPMGGRFKAGRKTGEGGIGAKLTKLRLVRGQPGQLHTCGVKVGMFILSIDGKDMSRVPFAKILNVLKSIGNKHRTIRFGTALPEDTAQEEDLCRCPKCNVGMSQLTSHPTRIEYNGSTVHCDECGKQDIVRSCIYYYHCDACCFDLCDECGAKRFAASARVTTTTAPTSFTDKNVERTAAPREESLATNVGDSCDTAASDVADENNRDNKRSGVRVAQIESNTTKLSSSVTSEERSESTMLPREIDHDDRNRVVARENDDWYDPHKIESATATRSQTPDQHLDDLDEFEALLDNVCRDSASLAKKVDQHMTARELSKADQIESEIDALLVDL